MTPRLGFGDTPHLQSSGERQRSNSASTTIMTFLFCSFVFADEKPKRLRP